MTPDLPAPDASPPRGGRRARAARCEAEERYREIVATAREVQAPAGVAGGASQAAARSTARERARRRTGHVRRGGRLGLALCLAVASVAVTATGRTPLRAVADSGADSQMFQLTNQDRTSNGVGPLGYLGSLQTVAESWTYSCNGVTVHGRADDMLQRNYFSHVILGCGEYVWVMMSAYGLSWLSAGENLGWSAGFGDASSSAGYTNTALMNSPTHRANILNSSYTTMGVGSGWEAGPWTGAGSPVGNVSMFAELFMQQRSSPPPTAKPTPRPPAPTPPPATHPSTAAPTPAPPRNEPAPTPSLPTAVATAVPTPAATPTPAPPVDLTSPLTPSTPESAAPPPLELAPGDLLGDTVDAVLSDLLLG